MLPKINEVFSQLSTTLIKNNTKFSCGPKFTVADFCIAALYFQIKEMAPELLTQVQQNQNLKPYLNSLELYLRSASAISLTPSPVKQTIQT